jgi:hypothetical protein
MIATLTALVLIALAIGLGWALGGVLLPVLLVLVGLVVVGWIVMAVARRTPRDVLQRVHLGPGGPDTTALGES